MREFLGGLLVMAALVVVHRGAPPKIVVKEIPVKEYIRVEVPKYIKACPDTIRLEITRRVSWPGVTRDTVVTVLRCKK